MSLWSNFKKTVKDLPSRIRPMDNSLYYQFMNDFGWSFTKANKSIGDLDTYYNAYNNVYVKPFIKLYFEYALIHDLT